MSAQAIDIQHTGSQTAKFEDAPLPSMTPDQMAFQLIRNGADFQSVREMVALSKEIAADKARNVFNEAVALAKSEIPVISKNATGHNNKTYANFAAYAAVVDPIIAKHGLRYRFKTDQADRITVTCVLSHKDGHSEENSLSGPVDTSGNKNAMQAIGSTLTYLQRYTLIQALGLAASDDDDAASHGKSGDQLRKISEEQRDRILDLIVETDTDIAQFCKVGKIDAIGDLLAIDYDNAVNLLEQKKQRMAK